MKWKINNILFGDEKPSKHEGKTILLLTIKELQSLKISDPKHILIDIFGDEKMAIDCNEDVRGGFVAYGNLKSE